MAATTLEMKIAAENLFKSKRDRTLRYYAQAYEEYVSNEERNKSMVAQA